MSYQNLTDPTYSPSAAPETGAMKTFSNLVHSYLDLVQRNTFPPDFIKQLLNGSFNIGSGYKDILNYEIGYLVALAIGVLFIILMILVGLFFACCRCCGNCGGKMYQKQTKRMNCKRRFEYWFLMGVTLVILAGDICAFYSNSKIDNSVNNSFNSFSDTLGNLKTYINSVPKDVDIIVSSSSIPINQANSSITGIGPILGGMIKSSIEQTANGTLDSVQNMVNVLNGTAIALVSVNNTFNTLQDLQTQLTQNLSSVKTSIDNTVTACGSLCSSAPSTSGLTMDANFNSIPNFSSQLQSINDFLNSGIGSTLQDARQTLNDIPQTVTNQTKSTVQSVQNDLGSIRQKISNIRSNIPIVDTLNNVTSYVNQASSYSAQYQPDVVKYEYYRWIVGICLCCVILLIVVCNLFGLLLGPCGHRGDVDPTDRGCASNSGGDFFMAGAGFSFIFAWLLMLVTAVLFAVGGNVYTSLCKPWNSQELYQIVDNNVNLSRVLNLGNIDISLNTIYSDCKQDQALWTTLNLGKLYNLDEILNISQYTSSVNQTLESTNINLNNITFLNADQRNKVTNVSNSGIDTLDFSNITAQMTKNITKVNLTLFADQLDALASSGVPSTTATELRAEATSLRNIQASINANLLPQIKNMNSSITNLQAISKPLPGSLNATLNNITATQTFVDTKVVGIIKAQILAYLNTILGFFQAYISWTKTMLTTQLARCGPVASALDTANVVACQYVVDTFNAFWFSIGWCTIFFIPSIILSVKLAKHYRRMKTSDVYE
ncbi:prominin-1-A-like isoform X2 [Hyperolius riggenbachi]